MIIQLDNGTTIEITDDIISIINGDRGLVLNAKKGELHTAAGITDASMQHYSSEHFGDLIALSTKLTQIIAHHLDHFPECCEMVRENLDRDDLKMDEIKLYKHAEEPPASL